MKKTNKQTNKNKNKPPSYNAVFSSSYSKYDNSDQCNQVKWNAAIFKKQSKLIKSFVYEILQHLVCCCSFPSV